MDNNPHSLRKRLIRLLASGGIHSGADLARRLHISRTAIWKHINYLRNCGMLIDANAGQGYQLSRPVELLQKKKIQDQLFPDVRGKIRSLELLFETGSTNQVLVERQQQGDIHGRVVLAEYQSHGRGRRGNAWISPMAGSINLSLGWHYDIPPQQPGCQ